MFKARGGFGGIALCIVFSVSGPRRPGFFVLKSARITCLTLCFVRNRACDGEWTAKSSLIPHEFLTLMLKVKR